MAKQVVTTTTYTDDIEGSAAAETVAFAFDGQAYEIDLSKSNKRAFGKTMALYVGHARKSRAARKTATRKSSSKYDLTDVRAWASKNGHDVSERGRIAQSVLDAYDAAH